jgi:hypothetical protein
MAPTVFRDPLGLMQSTSGDGTGSAGGGALNGGSGGMGGSPQSQLECTPAPNYFDVNVTPIYYLDFGVIWDGCGFHAYGGWGLGSPGTSLNWSGSTTTCATQSFQGYFIPAGSPYISLGGAIGSQYPAGSADPFREYGVGSAGGGFFNNVVWNCPV